MKFKTLALAAIAGAISVSAALAQTPDNLPACNDSTCRVDGRGPRPDKMYRPQKFTDYAFEGILLTVDQQGKIDALNAQLKAPCDSAACTVKKDCKKDDGRKSTHRKDGRKGRKGGRHHGIDRNYVNAVKGILTPEQYTTFLENIIFMPPRPDFRSAAPGKAAMYMKSYDKTAYAKAKAAMKKDKAKKKAKKDGKK